jgi:hypothetical protein
MAFNHGIEFMALHGLKTDLPLGVMLVVGRGQSIYQTAS